MQLLFPSLVLLLASVAIAFFVFPRVAPMVLVVGSAITFLLALYVHWSQFGVAEYERSTWQNNLRQYSSLLMMAVVLLAAYGFYAMNQGGAGETPAAVATATASANAANAANAATAVPTAGGGFRSVFKTVASRLSHLFKHGRMD